MCGSVCVCGPVRVSLYEVMCCVSALLGVVLGDVLHAVLAGLYSYAINFIVLCSCNANTVLCESRMH